MANKPPSETLAWKGSVGVHPSGSRDLSPTVVRLERMLGIQEDEYLRLQNVHYEALDQADKYRKEGLDVGQKLDLAELRIQQLEQQRDELKAARDELLTKINKRKGEK